MLGLFRKNGEDVIKRLEDRMDDLRRNLENAYLAKDEAVTDLIEYRSGLRSEQADKKEDFVREKRELSRSFEETIRELESKILDLENQIKVAEITHENEIAKITADTEVAQITYKARIKQELNDKYEAENSSLKDTIQEITADRSNYHGLYEGALLVIQSLEEQLAGQMSLIESLIGKTPSVDVKVSTPTTIAGQIVEKSK